MIIGHIEQHIEPSAYGDLVEAAVRARDYATLTALARELAIKLAAYESQCDFMLDELRRMSLKMNQRIQAVRDE